MEKRTFCMLFVVMLFFVHMGVLFSETRWYPIDELKLTTSDKVTVKVSVSIAYDSENEKQLKNYGGAIPLRLKLIVLKNHSYEQMLNTEKIISEIKNYIDKKIFDYPVITAIKYECKNKKSLMLAQRTVFYNDSLARISEYPTIIGQPYPAVPPETSSQPEWQQFPQIPETTSGESSYGAASYPSVAEVPAEKIPDNTETYPVVTETPAESSSGEVGFFGFLESLFGSQNSETSSALIDESGMTVETRIKLPEGYERVEVTPGSYEDFYRKLPLKSAGASIYYYDGRKKGGNYHVAVYDFPTLNEDLLQCADSCMKMRAEYYYARGEYDKIGFNAESGVYLPFRKYMDGYRLTGSGWKSGYEKGSSRKIFDEYLRIVYSYASTRSMAKEMLPVDINNLRIGDVFVQSGSPGHAVFVTDMAVNKKTGKKIMLIGQGYMPSQDLHIVKSFDSISPWFYVTDESFGSFEFTFPKGSQGRWPER
ncbi:MAG: hypothetical protein IJP61_06155 [Treponema sp.]|nr:hypothetical protein [Treponema sp.]